MKPLQPGVWPLLTGIFAAASAYCGEAPVPAAGIQAYPATPFVVNVTQPPYSARGDGVTDDTEALQRALNENVGRHKALYFPRGTYLVSRTLTWPKKWNGRDNWGKTMLRGEQRDLATSLNDGGPPSARCDTQPAITLERAPLAPIRRKYSTLQPFPLCTQSCRYADS